MVRESDFMEPFLVKHNKAVYELTVTMMQKHRKELEITKVIDAYPGEIGKRYANNLLLRMGNKEAVGTEFEKIPWEESKSRETWERTEDFAYLKSTENGAEYILITARWYPKRREFV